MKYKSAYLILFTFVLMFMFGCNDNNDFQSAYEQFWNLYYKATESFNSQEERFVTLKKIDTDSIQPELDDMKKSLDVLKSAKKTDREKSTYADLKIVYDDLLYLVSIHDKIDNLSDDEKMNVENKIVEISIYRDGLEKDED